MNKYKIETVDFENVQGKVIGEFVCDEIDEYNSHNLPQFNSMGLPCGSYNSYLILESDYKKMCLSYDEVKAYGKGKPLYCWHISNLKIYDKPRELSEFRKHGYNQDYERWDSLQSIGVSGLGDMAIKYPPEPNKDDYILKRPPQSWQYVEEVER